MNLNKITSLKIRFCKDNRTEIEMKVNFKDEDLLKNNIMIKPNRIVVLEEDKGKKSNKILVGKIATVNHLIIMKIKLVFMIVTNKDNELKDKVIDNQEEI